MLSKANNRSTPDLNLYLIPGMSAGEKSFEALSVPENCSATFVPWLIPHKDETIVGFSKRMMDQVISTVKSSLEKPPWMRWANRARINHLLPYGLAEKMTQKPFELLPARWKRKWNQYNDYLPMRDPKYLEWGVNQVLRWEPSDEGFKCPVYHLHGQNDELFPVKYIAGHELIPDAPHIMILTHGKAVSKLLARICTELIKPKKID
jgi:pimeloyl-ACP methyl ester carboxylesterase